MNDLIAFFKGLPSPFINPLAAQVAQLFCEEGSFNAAGFPQSTQKNFDFFKNNIPHLLGMGHQNFEAMAEAWRQISLDADLFKKHQPHLERIKKWHSTLVYTAAVTAPPDLWLLKNVLAAFSKMGLHEKLLSGGAIEPQSARFLDEWPLINQEELATDCQFLQCRGLLKKRKQRLRDGRR